MQEIAKKMKKFLIFQSYRKVTNILEQERASQAHVHSHDRDRGRELGGFEMEM